MTDERTAASRRREWFGVYCRFVNATCAYLVAGYLVWRLFG
jgi:hypothetical protein